jgi:hypothetical protein
VSATAEVLLIERVVVWHVDPAGCVAGMHSLSAGSASFEWFQRF